MAHLASFRKGWRAENLARYLLSLFSFISQPSTVSDDVGSDFFCTLFEVINKGNHEYLDPLNSFAIQIKSNSKKIDMSNKISYLLKLEIPFFVGVISLEPPTLTVYSGEALPLVFSHYGRPKRLKIALTEDVPKFVEDYYDLQGDLSVVRFPKVAKLHAGITAQELEGFTKSLKEICSTIYRSIASKSNGEYIFELTRINPPQVSIFAGSGSANVFRENFLKRLAEVFYNLEWLFLNNHQDFSQNEMEIFQRLLTDLRSEYKDLPGYLEEAYKSAISTINDKPALGVSLDGGVSLRFDPVTESIVQGVLNLPPSKRNDLLDHVYRLLEDERQFRP